MKRKIKLFAKKRWLHFKYTFILYNHARIGLIQKIRAIHHGFSSDFWKAYDLKHNNPKNYIPEYMRLYSREIDGDFKTILDNKILFTEYFERYVEVPKIKFLILDSIIYDEKYQQLAIDEFLSNFRKQKYIIKPIDGGGGHGVHIIEEKDGLYIDYKKASKNAFKELIKKCNGSIVNELIIQHDYSSKIYPKSVNTIRIITIKEPKTNKIILPCAAHRFGNSATGAVDNVSSGGYVAQVNVEAGIIGYAKKFSDPTTLVEIHPDTNAQIKGIKIPRWNKICNELIAAHEKMPYIPFIAWDVAITKENYSILETNASCSLELFQMFDSLKGTKLWDFYKHHGIVK